MLSRLYDDVQQGCRLLCLAEYPQPVSLGQDGRERGVRLASRPQAECALMPVNKQKPVQREGNGMRKMRSYIT